MRITLDTNVLIAAFISRGTCHEIFEHIVSNHQLVISDFILQEFKTTLINKFKFAERDVCEAIEILKFRTVLVEPVNLDRAYSSDPDDDNILATAISGSSMCILSGDKDLTELIEVQGIKIIKPSEFWKFETKQP